MRILHAIWSMGLGGAEALLVDILNRQVRSANVALMVGNAVAEEAVMATLSPDIAVHCIGRPPGSHNPWYLYSMNRKVRAFCPDIIHTHNPTFISALPLYRGPSILTAHNTRCELSVEVGRYDSVVSISRAVRDNLSTRSWCRSSTVIHNGIDFDAINPREWKSVPDRLRIVQVSRLLTEQKGQDILLDAIREVIRDRGSDSVTVDFIGDGPDGERLRSQAARLGLTERCRFLGGMARHEVYQVLPGYDLLVQPSRSEGFGLTVVEGVAAGLPVVCSNLEGPREIFENLDNSYLFTPNSPGDCARQILRVMDDIRTPGFGMRMTVNRSALRLRFDIDVTVAAYLCEYERVLGCELRSSGLKRGAYCLS